MAENDVLRLFCLLEAAEAPDLEELAGSTAVVRVLRCWNFSRIDDNLV